MSLEVWAELLGGSRWLYLISALVKDLLKKNTGLNFASPHSLNKAALTAISEAAW